MTATVAELIIRLQDEASKQAGDVARALADIAKQEGAIGTQSAEMGKLVQQLEATKAAAAKADVFAASRKKLAETRTAFNAAKAEVERQAAAIAAAGDGATTKMQNALNRARTMVSSASSAYTDAAAKAKTAYAQIGGSIESAIGIEDRLRKSVLDTTEAIKKQAEADKARNAAAAQQRQAEINRNRSRANRRDIITGGAAVGGMIVGYKARQFGRDAVTETADYSIASNKQQAFLDIPADVQKQILEPQAKRIGQETIFTNTDVVRAQTASMQGLPGISDPKLKAQIGAGIVENVKYYAIAMEADMATSAEAIRSFLVTTHKDISTKDKALAEARRATNLLLKMAKLGGMNDDDVQGYSKFGLPTGITAGFNDTTLAALGSIGRRGGLHGDEIGVFVRAMASKLVAPTKKGLDALSVAGIDYNKFTTMPGGLSTEALEGFSQRRLGKGFTEEQAARISNLLEDPEVINSQEEFVTQLSEIVAENFTKKEDGQLRAADANKIAKMLADFQKLSVESVDVEGLLNAIMTNPKMSMALLNAMFTDKHGGKASILSDNWDTFKGDKAAIEGASVETDFAKNIADKVMSGLGGSFENLKGSIDNLKLSIGQANESILTWSFDRIGNALDAISNMGEGARQAATALGILAAGGGATLGAWKLASTFFGDGGLKGSALALDGSAAALTRAAVALGGSGVTGGAGAGAGAAAGGFMAWASRIAAVGGAALGVEAIANLTTPEEDKRLADGAQASQAARGEFGDATLQAARSRYQPWWKMRSIASEDANDPQYIDKYLNEMSIKRYGGPQAARVEVDGSSADSVKQTLDALDAATVAPKIDTTSIDDAEVKVNRLAATLRNLSTMSTSVRAPSVDQTIRGIHADPGIGRAR